jgi:hypothetical protein
MKSEFQETGIALNQPRNRFGLHFEARRFNRHIQASIPGFQGIVPASFPPRLFDNVFVG